MIYIVCFALSAVFAWLANNKSKNKILFYTFSVLSILSVLLLAGLRGFNVGIDVHNYFEKNFYWNGAIKSAALSDYLYKYLPSGYLEPFFGLLTGIIAQFTGNFQLFLFVSHLIIIVCMYIGAFRFRDHVNPELVLIIFYFFFFNQSLNVIRQFIAMAIIFAFFADIVEKKYSRYAKAVIIASLFHLTALLAFGPLIIHMILYANVKIGTVKQRKIFILSNVFLAVIAFSPLVKLAIKLGFLNKRYSYFFESETIEPAMIIAVYVLATLISVFIFKKEMRNKSEYFDFLTTCSIAYLFLLFLTFTVAYSKRIAIYFALPDMLTLALIQSSQEEKKKKLIVTIGIIGAVLVYWLYIYAFRNASGTFPYETFFGENII